jgi:hypothetical protein
MNRLFTFCTILLLLSITYVQAQTFPRTAEIKDPVALERGFGAIVAGVDFDGDGLPEIYACNTNMVDGDYELIPRLYKFEWNLTTSTWDSVWGVVAPVELQNTWPALTWGDLDKDGKPELYWGPVNNIGTDLNPARVLVYEYPGNSSDNMGVDDGFGGFEPNAKTSIVTTPSFNLRPCKFEIADPDNDGTDELIFCERAATWHLGILSVDDIPDNGGGLETWTTEFSGEGIADLAGTPYDFVVVENIIVLVNSTGTTALIKYEGGSWVTTPPQSGVMENNSSFKGSVKVKYSDNSTGVYVGSWLSGKVYFVDKPNGVDTLVSYAVADFSPYAVRLNGGSAGDLDNDGNPDMVFGSRYMVGNTARVPIFRLEYQGGDKTLPSSYTSSIIDSGYWDKNGDMDVICVANTDGDASDEVLYTQGYSRGNANDDPMPIIILDPQFTPVSVEQETDVVPEKFYVAQNYPNPFNPSTQIKFGITEASNVDLRVYDILGSEIAVIVNNQYMSAGSYNVKFDASKLSSGVYIYKLTSGANTVSRKMQLLK